MIHSKEKRKLTAVQTKYVGQLEDSLHKENSWRFSGVIYTLFSVLLLYVVTVQFKNHLKIVILG